MKRAIFTFFLLLSSFFVFANNIQLQKVSLADTNRTAQTVNIKMNISWEHSWRDSINWDAAWIIIKYKEPKDSIWKWKHAQLSQTGNDLGTGVAAMKIVVPDDRMGAFFYRSAIGSGNVSNENVKLLWNYGAAGVTNIDSVEVRVFATEMVYVPEGSFCLGDGNGTNRSGGSFQLKSAPNNYAVISDRWSRMITGGNDTIGFKISGTSGVDMDDDQIADFPNYPTGYKAFYCMKYKVTQGQYTDFLNTVCVNDTTESLIQNYHITSDPNLYTSFSKHLQAAWGNLGDFIYLFIYPTDKQRHAITFDSVQSKFIVTRPDRVYALMNMNKGLSFSEWFGLRPMSELEYEKACRGPLPPMYNEYAWGNDADVPKDPGIFGNKLTFNGIENGTEYFTDYDITKRYFTFFSGGDGGTGPYRAGIYANDTSSRISAQASYYGIMDFGKITNEVVVPLDNSTNRLFKNSSHGKGVLSAFGANYFANEINANPYPLLIRGNSVSGRLTATPSSGATYTDMGFRAVRLAPSDN